MKSFMKKLIIRKNQLKCEGEEIPRFYGVAYIEMNKPEIVYAIIPLNVILYWYKKIRYKLKTHGAVWRTNMKTNKLGTLVELDPQKEYIMFIDASVMSIEDASRIKFPLPLNGTIFHGKNIQEGVTFVEKIGKR